MVIVHTIAEAAQEEKRYYPNEHIAESLSKKFLVMFVGPVAIGKSFVMRNLEHSDTRFGRVSVFTTREPRADDEPGMFRIIPHDKYPVADILKKISNQEVVQYAVHPTSRRLYGSELSDYQYEYNLLPPLSSVVGTISKLPFKHTFLIGLVTEPKVWQRWLSLRYPEKGDEYRKRLNEAVQSLDWLLQSDRDIIWIHNLPEKPEDTIAAILDAILYNKKDDSAKSLVYALRDKAEELQ